MEVRRATALAAFHRDALLEDTMPFWLEHAVDDACGGFFSYLDADGSVYHTDKPMWIQGRFTWLNALLYNEVERRPEWLAAAEHGIRFIERHGFDADGRMFYEVTRDGRPLRKRRYLFTETFGVIAFSEYARAAGDEERLERARGLYRLILHYHRNPDLLPPKILPQTRRAKAHAMPMILLATTQQLRKTGDDPLYEEVVEASLGEVFEDFCHPEVRALLETVGPDGDRLDSPEGRCVNPGHAIETAWFILEEGRHRGDPDLINRACRILDWSLELGWDPEYGGLFYFVDIEHKPCLQYEHDMKLWWPHCEALYATLLAHHLTGDARYEQWYETIHEWTHSRFPDAEHGEWYKYLHRDGTPASTAKGNAWAGPFHVPRMQLYCWKLLEEMTADSGDPDRGQR